MGIFSEVKDRCKRYYKENPVKEEGKHMYPSYPKDITVRNGNEVYLNKTKLIYEGRWDGWEPHPLGVVIRIGNLFFLHGEKIVGAKLLYDGEWTAWRKHPQGVLIINGDEEFVVYDDETKRRSS